MDPNESHRPEKIHRGVKNYESGNMSMALARTANDAVSRDIPAFLLIDSMLMRICRLGISPHETQRTGYSQPCNILQIGVTCSMMPLPDDVIP